MDAIVDHPRTDLLIVGGGPVGATLALAVARLAPGTDITLLEAASHASRPADGRTLALSHGSRLVLERLGVWERLAEPTPIRRIHVSERGVLGRTVMTAEELGLPALGYVLDYGDLVVTLRAMLEEAPIAYRTGVTVNAVTPDEAMPQASTSAGVFFARLVAIADGGRDVAGLVPRRVRDYGASAVVCQVECTRPSPGLAFERFTPEGPMALLPFRDRYALVWTAPHGKAEAYAALPDDRFLAELGVRFGDRVGRFTAAGPRQVFPLRAAWAAKSVAARTVLLGNAAQTLHPVAGQGFNLGLRDAWTLAEQLAADDREHMGSSFQLARYARARRLDVAGGLGFTDFLVRGFTLNLPGLAPLRGAALGLLDVVAPARRFLMRRMIFGAWGL